MRETLLFSLLAAFAASANERFFAAEVMDALEVKTVPAGPRDPVWKEAHPKTHACAAQRSVRLNDKAANAELGRDVPTTFSVRAAATDTELAVLVEWKDPSKSMVSKLETASFGDAAAIEFPLKFGGALRLPHVGMGDDALPVAVYLERATEEGPVTSTFVGGGFGSLTRARFTVRGAMDYDAEHETWRAMFVRPLVDGDSALTQGLVPVGFAFWEGGRSERGGNKYISSWKFIRLSKYRVDEALLARVSWGYGLGDLGDPIKGKQLFEVVCMACHWTEQKRIAPVGLAPDLSGIGTYQLPAYIKESILTPSEVIVHNLHLNRVYDKSAAKDKNGAYPNQTLYSWFSVGPDGKRASKMPPFAHFTPQEVGEIVAYLKTLDGVLR